SARMHNQVHLQLLPTLHTLLLVVVRALAIVVYFFYTYGDHRDLHSFPTRRSSDLAEWREPWPPSPQPAKVRAPCCSSATASWAVDRKSTRLNSSHLGNSYAVFCLKKKKKPNSTSQMERHWCRRYTTPTIRSSSYCF